MKVQIGIGHVEPILRKKYRISVRQSIRSVLVNSSYTSLVTSTSSTSSTSSSSRQTFHFPCSLLVLLDIDKNNFPIVL